MRTTKNNDDITSMAPHTDAMIGVGRRWWKFRDAEIDKDSWEVEWRSDGKLYLHDDTGNVVEGIEVSAAETEQLSREMLLADVVELALAKLRSGEGWDEGTITDVLNEIEHATGARKQPRRGMENVE